MVEVAKKISTNLEESNSENVTNTIQNKKIDSDFEDFIDEIERDQNSYLQIMNGNEDTTTANSYFKNLCNRFIFLFVK